MLRHPIIHLHRTLLQQRLQHPRKHQQRILQQLIRPTTLPRLTRIVMRNRIRVREIRQLRQIFTALKLLHEINQPGVLSGTEGIEIEGKFDGEGVVVGFEGEKEFAEF